MCVCVCLGGCSKGSASVPSGYFPVYAVVWAFGRKLSALCVIVWRGGGLEGRGSESPRGGGRGEWNVGPTAHVHGLCCPRVRPLSAGVARRRGRAL